MKYFYPLGKNPEKDPVVEHLPKGFQSAAKIFYPFIRMPSGWQAEQSAISHRYYPVKKDILEYGTPITWEALRQKTGLKTIAQMSIAVTARLTDGLGREIYQRPELADLVEEAMDANVYFPLEDEFPVLIMKDMLKVLGSNGARKIKFDKLAVEGGTYELHRIKTADLLELCTDQLTIVDENEEFGFTCFFDEAAAVFFTKHSHMNVLKGSGLEGVFLYETTPSVWEPHPYQYFC
ncbi:DUF2711 domain-containing protein [Halobacillus salinarum]|uniref:DUF2711 domain-containing protein n=1 Tax=Halobacillus salinarum TaxID=2932257 RepID=A0ABY4EQ52_9BACI|nr:DUF2711 family protein [Halobacillus salinarum]UOQ45764.1 DUF2711 domain-containing protein [Halobacillus salinarum]